MSVVAGVSMFRDEVDVARPVLLHMASQVDFLIVADNRSVDGTRDVLEEVAGYVDLTVVDDPEIGYYQAQKMTRLAAQAVERGAGWVVPFDADEIWIARDGRPIREALSDVDRPFDAAVATLFDHMATGQDDFTAGFPGRYPWRRKDPQPLHKMAGRARPGWTMHITQGNHHVRFGKQAQRGARAQWDVLEVRHFPYRSVGQLIQKVRNGAEAYAATKGLPPDAGAHWRGWGDKSDEWLRDLFFAWYWRDDPTVPHRTPDGVIQPPLERDPAPVGQPA